MWFSCNVFHSNVASRQHTSRLSGILGRPNGARKPFLFRHSGRGSVLACHLAYQMRSPAATSRSRGRPSRIPRPSPPFKRRSTHPNCSARTQCFAATFGCASGALDSPVRFIVGISLLLWGIGTLSCRIEGSFARPSAAVDASQWVRTVDGWEQPHWWRKAPPATTPPHPLVIAAGQCLVSVFALVACQRENARNTC